MATYDARRPKRRADNWLSRPDLTVCRNDHQSFANACELLPRCAWTTKRRQLFSDIRHRQYTGSYGYPARFLTLRHNSGVTLPFEDDSRRDNPIIIKDCSKPGSASPAARAAAA